MVFNIGSIGLNASKRWGFKRYKTNTLLDGSVDLKEGYSHSGYNFYCGVFYFSKVRYYDI